MDRGHLGQFLCAIRGHELFMHFAPRRLFLRCEFAVWLVGEGIDSISLAPDVAIATAVRLAAAYARPTAETVT